MQKEKSSKLLRVILLFILQLIVLPIALILLYVLSIYVTSGYGGGKLAAMITIILVILLFIVANKVYLKRNKIQHIIFVIILFLFSALVVYTIIPVASTAVIEGKEKNMVNVPTNYWKLTTGSNIAYYKLNATRNSLKKEFPIIFLHGGPGAYVRQIDLDFFSLFTNDGYDVYLYDQAGGGRSGLLDKSNYSHDRNIRDFESIINVIKAKKYIVIGQSYGGSLLAHLAADERISKRIYKAIYSEPGITLSSNLSDNEKKYASSPFVNGEPFLPPLRLIISMLIDPKGEFATQNEYINYFIENPSLIQGIFSTAYPKDDSIRVPKVNIEALNFSVNRIITSEVANYKSKEQLAENYKKQHVPSMLMLGESSYIERNGPLDLMLINPNFNRVQYLKGVGHLLWNGLDDNNQKAKKVIDDFLNNKDSSIPNYPKTLSEVEEFYNKGL